MDTENYVSLYSQTICSVEKICVAYKVVMTKFPGRPLFHFIHFIALIQEPFPEKSQKWQNSGYNVCADFRTAYSETTNLSHLIPSYNVMLWLLVQNSIEFEC